MSNNKTITGALSSLKKSTSLDNKIALSKECSEILEKNGDKNLYGIFYRILKSISIRNRNLKIDSLMNSGFFKLNVNTYKDYDNLYKISIGIIFLQDYRNSIDNLDVLLIDKIIDSLQNGNLDLVFNDINVNSIHRFKNYGDEEYGE